MRIANKLSILKILALLVFKECGAECHFTLQEIIKHIQGNLTLMWHEEDVDLGDPAVDHNLLSRMASTTSFRRFTLNRSVARSIPNHESSVL